MGMFVRVRVLSERSRKGRVECGGGRGLGSDRSARASLPGGTSLEAGYTEAAVGRKQQTHPKVRIQPGGGGGRRHRSIVDDRGVIASKSGSALWVRRRKIERSKERLTTEQSSLAKGRQP